MGPYLKTVFLSLNQSGRIRPVRFGLVQCFCDGRWRDTHSSYCTLGQAPCANNLTRTLRFYREPIACNCFFFYFFLWDVRMQLFFFFFLWDNQRLNLIRFEIIKGWVMNVLILIFLSYILFYEVKHVKNLF